MDWIFTFTKTFSAKIHLASSGFISPVSDLQNKSYSSYSALVMSSKDLKIHVYHLIPDSKKFVLNKNGSIISKVYNLYLFSFCSLEAKLFEKK